MLVLRSEHDRAICTAALATRYTHVEPALRLHTRALPTRRAPPARAARELLQAGIESDGAPAPEGTAMALKVLCEHMARCPARRTSVGGVWRRRRVSRARTCSRIERVVYTSP